MDTGITKLYLQHKTAANDFSSVFLTGRSMV